MEQGAYPEAARYYKRVLQASHLPIGAIGATTRPTSAIEVIGRQAFVKQLLEVIATGVSGYSLWWFIEEL